VNELYLFLKLWIIVLVAVNAIRTLPQARLYMAWFIACFTLFPLRGTYINYFIYHYTYFGRALWNNAFGNSNDLAAISLITVSMVLALFYVERTKLVRLALIGLSSLIVLVIFLTQSRGALLAFGVVALVLLLKQKQRLRSLALAALAGMLVLAVAPDSVWDRLSGLRFATNTSSLAEVDQERSAESRYGIWRVAFPMIADHPVLGVGTGAYQYAHRAYADRMSDLPIGAYGRRDTHSTYFNALAETGFPGLFLFLGMIIVTLWRADQMRRLALRVQAVPASFELLCLELGIIGILLAGIFATLVRLNFLYISLAVLTALTEYYRAALRSGGPAAPLRGARSTP
jgi:O-antigen ligase